MADSTADQDRVTLVSPAVAIRLVGVVGRIGDGVTGWLVAPPPPLQADNVSIKASAILALLKQKTGLQSFNGFS